MVPDTADREAAATPPPRGEAAPLLSAAPVPVLSPVPSKPVSTDADEADTALLMDADSASAEGGGGTSGGMGSAQQADYVHWGSSRSDLIIIGVGVVGAGLAFVMAALAWIEDDFEFQPCVLRTANITAPSP